MKTYLAIGLKAGLNKGKLREFVNYMKKRWPGTETKQCVSGYAEEWAIRFKNGFEFECSDTEGREILKSI